MAFEIANEKILREELEQIVNVTFSKRKDFIDQLAQKYPNLRLQFVESPQPYGSEECFGYVFRKLFFLNENKLREIERALISLKESFEANKANGHDIALYFNEATVAHIGIIESADAVKSKWGPFGDVWIHPLFQVPWSYGSQVRYSAKSEIAEILKSRIDGL